LDWKVKRDVLISVIGGIMVIMAIMVIMKKARERGKEN
jgi:hypothetical protein